MSESDHRSEGNPSARSIPRAKTLALTGGSGRIGKLLRQELQRCFQAVRILDLADPGDLLDCETWYQTDICDLDAVKQSLQGVDAIIHLAGFPNERTIEDIVRVNVLGTHNIYEAARVCGIGRIVLGSSNHVTGFYKRGERVGPEDRMRPDSFYGLSKCWNELEASLYYEKFGIESFIIRIGNATMDPTTSQSDRRSKEIWVGPKDMAQLVMIGIEHEAVDCITVYGVSQKHSSWWDNQVALELGYEPQEGILLPPHEHAHLETAASKPEDRFQGGRFCAIGHDGVIRERTHHHRPK